MNNNFECIDNFLNIYNKDANGRYKSYEHCRNCFLNNCNDENQFELIALHLYAYLASWGMMRNSFLLQKDYLFNLPVVRILCKNKYRQLIQFNPFKNDCTSDIKLIINLRDEIKNYYLGQQYTKDGTDEVITVANVSDTLVTKIILGTIGCVPAYDQYFVKALRNEGICGVFNERSMEQLIQFAQKNQAKIKDSCEKLGQLYTPMKIIDMYFWDKGIKK